MKRAETRKMYSAITLPGRHIRSAMNDDYDDDTETQYDVISNKTNGMENDTVIVNVYRQNDTMDHRHILNKRLDPLVNQDDGQTYEGENQSNGQQNWASIDYPSLTANDSVLDHMKIINLLQRQHREGKTNGHLPTVRIHNIISGLPKPEIEMLYAVYQGTLSNSSLFILSNING